MNRKYSTEKVIESMKNYNCSNLKHDIYLFNYRNKIIEDLEQIFNLNLNEKYRKLSSIKKILN